MGHGRTWDIMRKETKIVLNLYSLKTVPIPSVTLSV